MVKWGYPITPYGFTPLKEHPAGCVKLVKNGVTPYALFWRTI